MTLRKPLPRKRATPRRFKTLRCEVRGCHLPFKVTWDDPLERPVSGVKADGSLRFLTGPLAGRTGTVVSEVHFMCDKHAKREAHARIRAFVFDRDGGRCVIPHADLFPCAGVWQPNHGFDRDEKSCTWAEWNVMGGCGAINTWAHHHKLRWYAMLRDLWGRDLYEERHEIMLRGEPMNVADVLAKYPPAPKRMKEEAA